MLNTLANNRKLKNYFKKETTEESILLSQDYNCEYKLNCPYRDFKSPVHILRDNEILLEKVKQYESHIIFADNEIFKGELNVNRKKIFKSGKKKERNIM